MYDKFISEKKLKKIELKRQILANELMPELKKLRKIEHVSELQIKSILDKFQDLKKYYEKKTKQIKEVALSLQDGFVKFMLPYLLAGMEKNIVLLSLYISALEKGSIPIDYEKWFSDEQINKLLYKDLLLKMNLERELEKLTQIEDSTEIQIRSILDKFQDQKNYHEKKIKQIKEILALGLEDINIKQIIGDDSVLGGYYTEWLKIKLFYLEKTTITLFDCISALERKLISTNNTESEQKEIEQGVYQYRLNKIYSTLVPQNIDSPFKKQDTLVLGAQKMCESLLLDKNGLRCAVTVPLHSFSQPIEIQVSFFGTRDFKSICLDLEDGGPGQETLKKYEIELLRKLNEVCSQTQKRFPNQEIRLQIAGHSLGGALAKAFSFSILRACAVLKSTPGEIIQRISERLKQEGRLNFNTRERIYTLKKQLIIDAQNIKELGHLTAITRTTVYALGAPGVSNTTDQLASLLTYYHDPDFLRIYHHYHKEDLVVKFGEAEFLSGHDDVPPRVMVNKALRYDVALTPEDRKASPKGLPFPGITGEVMAYHNKEILESTVLLKEPGDTQVTNLGLSTALNEKFSFSSARRGLYKGVFFAAKALAAIKPKKMLKGLNSFPECKKEAGESQATSYFFDTLTDSLG